MEKFLIVAFRTIIPDRGMRLITKLIKCLDAKATIVSPVDGQLIKRIAANEGLREETVRERYVHETYMHLYELEEKFKKEAIDVTIATMNIAHSEDLISEMKKTHPDLLCLAGDIDPELFEALRESLTMPILLLSAVEE